MQTKQNTVLNEREKREWEFYKDLVISPIHYSGFDQSFTNEKLHYTTNIFKIKRCCSVFIERREFKLIYVFRYQSICSQKLKDHTK